MNILENLRNYYDVYNPPIIKKDNSIDTTVLYETPTIDVTRINNYMEPMLSGRVIKDLDEIEAERARELGQRVDINIDRIVDDLQSKLIKIPKINAQGQIERYPDNSIVTEETSVFNLISRIPSMPPNSRIPVLQNGIMFLLQQGHITQRDTIAIRSAVESLSEEAIKQRKLSNEMIIFIKTAIAALGLQFGDLIKQLIDDGTVIYDKNNDKITFTKGNFRRVSPLLVLAASRFKGVDVEQEFKDLADSLPNLTDSDVIEMNSKTFKFKTSGDSFTFFINKKYEQAINSLLDGNVYKFKNDVGNGAIMVKILKLFSINDAGVNAIINDAIANKKQMIYDPLKQTLSSNKGTEKLSGPDLFKTLDGSLTDFPEMKDPDFGIGDYNDLIDAGNLDSNIKKAFDSIDPTLVDTEKPNQPRTGSYLLKKYVVDDNTHIFKIYKDRIEFVKKPVVV